jgi:hypothetical protein
VVSVNRNDFSDEEFTEFSRRQGLIQCIGTTAKGLRCDRIIRARWHPSSLCGTHGPPSTFPDPHDDPEPSSVAWPTRSSLTDRVAVA